MSLFLTAVVLLGVVLQRRVLGRRQFITVSGRAFRPRLIDVGRWRYALLTISFLYILVAAVIPYLVLTITAFRQVQFFESFSSVFSTDALSLRNLDEVFSRPELSRSITNAMIVGVATAVIGVVICFLLAYTTERTRLRGRGVLRAIATVPVAIPGLIIGAAFLWAWIGLPLGIYGTIWIVVVAFVARHVPDGHRTISSTMVQVHGELEEAARICGASWVRTMRTVMLPLVRGGLMSAAILLFVFSVREVGPALFLASSNTTLLSVQIIQSWGSGDVGSAAALALIQSGILLLVVGVARLLWRVDLPR
jgi:iron(III) transport system permease protein